MVVAGTVIKVGVVVNGSAVGVLVAAGVTVAGPGVGVPVAGGVTCKTNFCSGKIIESLSPFQAIKSFKLTS